MARNILGYGYRKNKYILSQAGMCMDDMAAVSIEELFLTHNNLSCYELQHYFESLQDPIDDLPAAEIVLSLRKLVSRKVSQALAETAAQSDPVYRKVHRNLVDIVRESPIWKKRELFHDMLIFRVPSAVSELPAREIEVEELTVIVHDVAQPGDTLEQILEHVFDEIEQSTAWRNGVALSALCEVLRGYFAALYKTTAESEITYTPILEAFELRDIIRQVAETIRSGILHDYFVDGQIAEPCISRYDDAIRAMLHDLVEKEPRPLFDYHLHIYPDTSYEHYRSNGRARFEYVMHHAKAAFITLCRRRME